MHLHKLLAEFRDVLHGAIQADNSSQHQLLARSRYAVLHASLSLLPAEHGGLNDTHCGIQAWSIRFMWALVQHS